MFREQNPDGLEKKNYPVLFLKSLGPLVMASFISSELAFSSAGITISKQCNQLKADIIEALQCLWCLYLGNSKGKGNP